MMPRLAYRTKMPKPDDPDLLKAYCQAIAQGHPAATAATIAGIGEATARDWMLIGEQALAASEDGELRAEELGSHAAFARAVKQAQADFVAQNLAYVNEARAQAKGWLPAMTLLERRRPRDFGRQQYLDVEQHNTHTIQLVVPPGAEAALLRLMGRTLPEQTITEGQAHQLPAPTESEGMPPTDDNG